jgi:hypothetical protein
MAMGRMKAIVCGLDFSATNLRVPRPPGFPVRLDGVNELHAAFLTESRVPGAPSFAHFAKGGIPRISIPTVAYPTLCQERKGWGTRLFVVLPTVPNTNRGLIEDLVSYQSSTGVADPQGHETAFCCPMGGRAPLAVRASAVE